MANAVQMPTIYKKLILQALMWGICLQVSQQTCLLAPKKPTCFKSFAHYQTTKSK
nr:MAG TPA: hypothetical protein [Caudoviricetes sp.]